MVLWLNFGVAMLICIQKNAFTDSVFSSPKWIDSLLSTILTHTLAIVLNKEYTNNDNKLSISFGKDKQST